MDLGPSIGGQLTRQSQQNSDSDDDDDIISIIHGIEIAAQEGAKGKAAISRLSPEIVISRLDPSRL